MTSPWNAAAAEAVKHSFGLRSFARATSPAWEDPIDLELVDWRLSVDEERAPHAHAIITIKTPDVTTLELLDPRQEVYIEIDAGYVYADGTLDVHNYVTLGLRACEDDPVNTVLTVASEEAFVDDGDIDVSRSYGSFVSGTYVEDLLSSILTTYTDVAITPTINNTVGDVTLPSPHNMSYRPYDVRNAVERAKQWAAAVDAVLWCDQQGVWQFLPTPALSTSQATIATGEPAGNITHYRRLRSRDSGWANRIVASYLSEVTATYGWEVQPSSPAGGGTYRDKTANLSFSYLPNGASVDANGLVTPGDPAVLEYLNRTQSRGRRLILSTVAHLWLRAGDTITAIVRGAEEDALVSAYEVSSDGSMTITTRTPQDEE